MTESSRRGGGKGKSVVPPTRNVSPLNIQDLDFLFDDDDENTLQDVEIQPTFKQSQVTQGSTSIPSAPTAPGSDQFHEEIGTSTVGGCWPPNPVHDWNINSFIEIDVLTDRAKALIPLFAQRRIRIPLPGHSGRFKNWSPGTVNTPANQYINIDRMFDQYLAGVYAPGSDQFYEEIGTSTVGCVGLLIRSKIGISIPSSVCTRKHDEDFTDGISSPERSEQVRRRAAPAWGGEERKGEYS
ncbi:hypothetical protein F511_27019 [Dorcoceras hygrometricum]|uniref:Uncharacterized protein n=1 Tax=Dorcoceras hygrometricum TaxID=472368 RepID=A0A2Z7D5P8_9LAMI|nr:hypothetical protein F511_27019 [Dorcoceras hygrometricum]